VHWKDYVLETALKMAHSLIYAPSEPQTGPDI